MKKIISLILSAALAVGALAGCGEVAAPSEKEGVIKYTAEGKETKLVPDETLSGELTVEYMGINSFETIGEVGDFSYTVEKFKELYPNVKLTYNFVDMGTVDYGEYYTKLSTQIMAGKGPDIFEVGAFGTDRDKLIKSGAVADMYEYFETDKNFNINDYNAKVFYSGQYEGGQYIFPTRYDIPVFLTTKEIADEIGLDIDIPLDYYETTEELLRIYEKNKNKEGLMGVFTNMTFSAYFPKYTGMPLYDLKTGEVFIGTEEFERTAALYKELLKYPSDRGSFFNNFGTYAAGLLNKKYTFLTAFPTGSFWDCISNTRSVEGEAVLFPYRDVNKKIQAAATNVFAVNSSCESKQNAYCFLKILMSEETQSRTFLNANVLYNSCIPISNKALNKLFDGFKQEEMLADVRKAPLSQKFIDRYLDIIGDIDNVVYDTDALLMIVNGLKPYFNDEKTYDECIKDVQENLEIYISE